MLVIHRAERADVLADALAELLVEPPADAFAAELVAVPTRGIERWLSQRLSATLGARKGGADGVCANVEFPSPGSLVAGVLELSSGIARDQDPWRPERLVWTLIEVVEQAIEEPWLDPLARHLRADRSQRYTRLEHLARLFDEYAAHRPELLRAWALGEHGADLAGPGLARHPALGWQRELWLRARERIGVSSPAERLEHACAALVRDPEVVPLPPRLALFGLTRLPPVHLTVLRALAERRDVHLMLLHPSAALWAGTSAQNRLLASWGRDVLGLQALLRGAPGRDLHHPLPESRPAQTLLTALQSDIRADRCPPGPPLRDEDSDERFVLAPGDRSVRIHACHGRARQVEVLREAILHRLQEDPTLEPREIIVMCPDIEAFAPLIEGTFGATDGEQPGEPPQLRVRLADRSLRRTTPLLATVAKLLELASSRVSASQVLDLADTAPVRRRFGFDDESLSQIRSWVAAAHIHWGIDATTREPFGLGAVTAGTWADGFRRMLLGVATDPAAGTPFAGVLASSAILSSQVDLVGRLREFVDRLDAALSALAGPHTLPGWVSALTAATDRLMATSPQQEWQRHQLDEILAELLDHAAAADIAAGSQGASDVPTRPPLSLAELRALVEGRLAGRPTRGNFRSGHLTFCTLVPMRSVPHRVVCLLGLDDASFPRPAPRDGDNLLLADPQPADRNPRTEDRQLLLDALLAAGEALIITYSGSDERTNERLPPAVPVGELLDAIDATARPAGAAAPGDGAHKGTRARDSVLVHHPLQPFDARNFMPEASAAAPQPWSFDAAALAGARALTAPRRPAPRLLEAPLAPTPAERLVTLNELVAFVKNPVLGFLRQRLGVTPKLDEDEVDDALPIQLDELERWSVGQRLLEALLRGADPQAAYRAEIARGTLPPGRLGVPVIRELLATSARLAAAARTHVGESEPRTEQTNLTLPGEVRLTGTVAGVRGNVLLAIGYSRLGPGQRLAAWVRLLALTAAHPELRVQAVTIGRGHNTYRGQPRAAVSRISIPGADAREREQTAREHLAALIELRAAGLREPLPLPCKTAHAYAEAALTGGDPIAAASERWGSRWVQRKRVAGEEEDPEHRMALGAELDWGRLAELACALWRPLLAHETVEER